MIGGGEARSLWRPIRPSGNSVDGRPNIRGTHKGLAASLNVENPQPGFHYYHESPKRAKLRMRAMEGWEVPPPDSPENKGLEVDQRFGQGLDGLHTRPTLVLLRIPDHLYERNVLAPKRQLARTALSASTEAYTSKGIELQNSRFGRGAGGPMYYRTPEHGLFPE